MRKDTIKASLLIILFNFIVFTLGLVPSARDGNMDQSGIGIWLLVIAVVNVLAGLFALMAGMGKAAWRPYAFCMLVMAGIMILTGIFLLRLHNVLPSR